MKKIAVVTDSNAGIKQKDVEGTDIYVVPMPFIIGEEVYYEDINLTQDEFFEKQISDVKISTSQPSIEGVAELWTDLLKRYDQIVHIPMSSALSMSCETAKNYAETNFAGKVFVVDNRRISISQKGATYDAITLASRGYSGKEIQEYLEKDGDKSSIYLIVDTLKYLKRGGRVTPAAAAISSILGIKPILEIKGGKLDKYGITRNIKNGKMKMIEALKADIEKSFKNLEDNGELAISVAHTTNDEAAQVFKEELIKEFPKLRFDYVDPLSLSVATHVGPKVIACGIYHFVK